MFTIDLNAAGTSAINYYKETWSVTTVTLGATYITTVRDWGTLAALSAYYSNPDSTFAAIASVHNSTEYALLQMYGSAINFYRAPINSTTFQPLEIKVATTNYVWTKNCP